MARKRTIPRIAVIYTHFPHYRSGVFDALGRNTSYDFQFFYDPGGIDPSIANGGFKEGHHKLKAYKWRSFIWQFGAIPLVLRAEFDGFIFLGSPYIVSTWLAAISAKLCKKPVLFWTHGWLRSESGGKGLARRVFYRLADCLLVYGVRGKEIGVSAGFSSNEIYVVGNSLDYNTQRKIRISLSKTEGPPSGSTVKVKTPNYPYFLCVSRLVGSSNIALAIEAIAKLPPDVGLLVVGEGPERLALERLGSELGVRTEFLGAIYDETLLGPLFTNARAVVSPGKIGLLALHSLAYGTPIITHGDLDWQMPEVEAIEPGVTGKFFERNNVKDLAEVMHSYYLMSQDSPSRVVIRNAAVKRIESEFTPDAQVTKIVGALDKTLKTH